ncbi:MAG: hypothetical protein A2Z32_03410 [Chloroflexi bacterium RBG_16_69_14]|nr:MAG: hypothetical protein A2Z32_03410 [Chloroflexi bacterium RBG_16_69_14]
MASRLVARFGVAVTAAAVVLTLSAGAALAGEITGNGKSLKPLHANSICAFSGQNDDPEEEFPFGGRVQSYGYSVVRNGLKAVAPSPGFACNGDHGFLSE